jgi:hypothetical protein
VSRTSIYLRHFNLSQPSSRLLFFCRGIFLPSRPSVCGFFFDIFSSSFFLLLPLSFLQHIFFVLKFLLVLLLVLSMIVFLYNIRVDDVFFERFHCFDLFYFPVLYFFVTSYRPRLFSPVLFLFVELFSSFPMEEVCKKLV